MRYGLVTTFPRVSVDDQKAMLRAVAPEAQILEASKVGSPNVEDALLRLRRGDDLLVAGLDVFLKPLAATIILLRNLLELGVTIHLVGEPDTLVIQPEGAMLNMLESLSELARSGLRLSREVENGGSLESRLSKHQIRYAHKLHQQGVSLREIGLLFQASPDEVWRLLSL